jgi:hypothetical protein
LVTSYSDVVAFLKSSETDSAIRLILIAIGVETEYRFVARSLSGHDPKGELNALIIAESEIMNFFILLKVIWRSDSSMIAIGVELEYRSVTRSLSRWGPKGDPNALIVAGSEVTDFLRQRHSCICSSGLL